MITTWKKIAREPTPGGPLWDAKPSLCFKVFAVQEREKHGAIANSYSSLYLWFEVQAAVDFVFGPSMQNVCDKFGRPSTDMWVPIDGRKGSANRAVFLHREDPDIPLGVPLAELRSVEIDGNATTASLPNTVVSIVGLNMTTWRLARFMMSDELPDVEPDAIYQVAYFAKPGLSQLP